MKNKNIFYFFVVIAFLIVIFFLLNSVWRKQGLPKDALPSQNNIQYVKIAGVTLKVELATTPQAQEQGLSGRNGLKENGGMLFIFNTAGKYPFWMKDMNFPIDIIWIAGEDSNDLRVVYIKKNASPESYPETFVSGEDARYVLEVISSFSEKNNLKVGDKVEFLSS